MYKFFLSLLFLVPGNLCAMKRALQVPEDVEILDVASSQNGRKTCIAYKGHDDTLRVSFTCSMHIRDFGQVENRYVALDPFWTEAFMLRLESDVRMLGCDTSDSYGGRIASHTAASSLDHPVVRAGGTRLVGSLIMLNNGAIKLELTFKNVAQTFLGARAQKISAAVFGEGNGVGCLCASSGKCGEKFFLKQYRYDYDREKLRKQWDHEVLQPATTLEYVHGDSTGDPEQQLFIGWQDGTSSVLDINTGLPIKNLQETPAPNITKMVHRHGSNWFLVAREDGSVKIFDRRTWTSLTLAHSDGFVGKNFVTMHKSADGTEGVFNVRQVKKDDGGWHTTMNEITDFDQTALVAYAGQRNVASKLLNRQIG